MYALGNIWIHQIELKLNYACLWSSYPIHKCSNKSSEALAWGYLSTLTTHLNFNLLFPIIHCGNKTVLDLKKINSYVGHCCRDSGNDFHFPDFASHTGRVRLIFVRISSVVSFWVDIQQLFLFLICHLFSLN